MDKRRVIYYSDELNDEFSLTEITPRRIDGDYVYCHTSLIKRFTHFFWYRIIFTPIAFFHSKLVHHHKTIGKEKFKSYKKTGYFMYGNHTQDIGDAFIPNMINFPKTNYVIVHPNNVSMPILGKVTPSMGALPLPDDREAYRNFLAAIEKRVAEKKKIVIYPEAHIWPYYTGVRRFSDVSFSYPVRQGAPVIAFFTAYTPPKGFLSCLRKANMTVYVSDPIYPDRTLPEREARKDLCERVHAFMQEKSQLSTYEVYAYRQTERTEEAKAKI